MMVYDDQYLEVHSPDDVRVKGTRVGIEHLLTAYLAGMLPEELCLEFPTVSLEQVHGVLAWYLGHREAADSYLDRWRATTREARLQQNDGGQALVVQRLRQLAEARVAR